MRYLTLILLFAVFITPCSGEFNKAEKVQEQKRQQEMKAHFKLAMSHFNKEDFLESEKLFYSFTEQYSDSEMADEARYFLALNYLKTFKLDLAEKVLDDLLDRYKTGAQAEKFKAVRNELSKLRNDLSFALDLTPDENVQKICSQAFELIRKNDLDSALLILLSNMDRMGGYLPNFYAGLAYEKKASSKHPDCMVDYQKLAVASYEKALSYRDGIEVLYNLGRIYRKLDQKEKSRNLYEKILRKYPGSDVAKQVESILSDDEMSESPF